MQVVLSCYKSMGSVPFELRPSVGTVIRVNPKISSMLLRAGAKLILVMTSLDYGLEVGIERQHRCDICTFAARR